MTRIALALSVATAGLILVGDEPKAVADESSTGADEKEEQQIRGAAPERRRTSRTIASRCDVDDGIAVLEGTVDSEREKKEAQQLAHVDGILGVNNRLQVRGAGK